MAGALPSAVWFLCVSSLGTMKPVDASHFMGGLIQWRPVNPAAFDGQVEVTHRIVWKRSSTEGNCAQATIDAQTLLPSGGPLTCQSGCSGSIGDFSYYCTDFSVADNWSAGERTYTYNFTESSFEARFATCCWISLIIGSEGSWEFRVRGNLTYREDTGLINSSPVVNILPLIRLQHGCNHIIKIPVVDVDGDHIRCRWANSSHRECGGVCTSFPANLNETACELEYQATGQAGRYAVALQIEDFASPTDTTPLSSIPVQFVVHVFTPTPGQPCSSQPQLVGTTPPDGSSTCVSSSPLSSWRTAITARVVSNTGNNSITEIVTASPLGMRKSALVPSSNPREWQVIVTWMTLTYQSGPNIFCYSALDNAGLSSVQSCITLLNGVMPPKLVPGSVSPTGEIFSNHSIWSLQINRQFTRPSRDTFIQIFEEGGDKVVSINVATSSDIIYPSDALGRTLTFSTNYHFPENKKFYVMFDQGIAVGTEICTAESPALTDPTVWTFMIADVTPPKIQLKAMAPVITDEGIALGWAFDEEASSVCELYSPSMLNETIVPCLNNAVLLPNTEQGYSLFIQGTDVEGNVADPVQLTWSIVTITCGSVKLTNIELEVHTSDDSTSSLIYHCAESISANQTVTSVCSNDGDSPWNPDPASHGCANVSNNTTEKKEYGNIIIIVSTVLAFILGIFCGLLPYHCIRSLLTRRANTRQLQEIQATKPHVEQNEELVSNDLYEEVNTAARYKSPYTTPNTHMELKPNVAYGQY